MKKILVVDDDPMITRLVKTDLELSGFTVEEAWEGAAAMRMLEDDAPDLLILDIMMPHTNGWDILKMVREREDLQDLPVIVLTAVVHEEDVARGWEMGADDFITKPFNPIALADRVRELLESTPEERKEERKGQFISRLGILEADSPETT